MFHAAPIQKWQCQLGKHVMRPLTQPLTYTCRPAHSNVQRHHWLQGGHGVMLQLLHESSAPLATSNQLHCL